MAKVTMGKYSYGEIRAVGKRGYVLVGKYTSIASNVTAILVGHNVHNISTFPFSEFFVMPIAFKSNHPVYYGNVIIGNDCWIGYGSTIMGGVTISDGAIVAANAIVTKNVEPYTVVGGAPARVLKKRFNQNWINSFMELKWWDWPEEKVKRYAHLLCSDKILDFFAALGGE